MLLFFLLGVGRILKQTWYKSTVSAKSDIQHIAINKTVNKYY
jgi:hypothetical protein